MAQELIYTSAKRGLRPGTRGFCTVAYTEGLRPEAIQLLESLSAYKEVFPVHHAKAALNPVAVSHYQYALGTRRMTILSRVAPTMADHTLRSNKIAHHVVLSKRELPEGGPAWLCSQDGLFLEAWDQEPHRIAEPREVPAGTCTSTHAKNWEAMTGDAGWAGALAYSFLSGPRVPAFIVYEPGMDVLPLLVDAQALIAPDRRWQITFNTYHTSLPTGANCAWRCCVAGSEYMREANRTPRTLVIDLTKPLGSPPNNALVECARTGSVLPMPVAAAGGADAKPKDAFVVMPNRNRAALRMRPDRREDRPRS